MDMIVVFGALVFGLVGAVVLQMLAYLFKAKSHTENVLVGGGFAVIILVSAEIIANLLGA